MNSKNVKELLKKRNLKSTKTRLSLLSKMTKFGSAISHSELQKQMSPIDRVTFYRTLETLKNKGIIHKAFQENNDIYYAICGNSCKENEHRHEHVHFKCIECSTISCQKLDQSIDITVSDFIIDKISINLEGICKLCA